MISDTKARQAKPRDKIYRIADAKGLALEVRPSGQKFWRYRFRLDGKANMFTIGEYPAMGLAEARQKLEEARALVAQGINPNTAKRTAVASRIKENLTTFRSVAEEWIASSTHWSRNYAAQVSKTLALNAYPKIGNLPLNDITPAQMLAIINEVQSRGAPTVARNLRQWCGATFRYGITTLRCDSDPTAPLSGVVRRGKVKHHPPLKPESLPDFLRKLDGYLGYGVAKPATQLMLMTFVRTIEIRRAQWEDFDLDGALWRIPGEKMKMGTEHIVPLSRQAVALLRDVHMLTGHRRFVFPNTRRPDVSISATTINRVIKYIGYAGVVSGHGFRSTASTMLHEMGYPAAIIELQLAHLERNKVKAAYNHAQYLDERRQMMQDWSDFLDQQREGG